MFTKTFIETLGPAVKERIAKDVAEAVYQQLKTDKYLEGAYIFKVAEEIANKTLRIDLVPMLDQDGFTIRTTVRK